MGRFLDADGRRRAVAEAAWRVLLRDGITALSVRNVAAEAGLPPSSLRYTFPTQAQVRDAAVELLLARLVERAQQAATDASGVAGARAMLLELLPLDDERRGEMEVTLSFQALAVSDPEIRRAYGRLNDVLRDVSDRAMALIGQSSAASELTVAVIDGIALHLLRDTRADAAQRARATLDYHLELLTT